MEREAVLVGIDVGTSKVCALIGEVGRDGRLTIMGHGTVPASGLKKGLELALSVRRRGHTPVVVVMTDGSGNIALDGSPDRALAARESEQIAGLYRAHRLTSICIDIARRPRDGVTQLAGQLGAPLHVLRRADRSQMSDLVHASMEAARS